MASVGQRDTAPEMLIRHVLHGLGLRYRLHDKKLPGSPDLVFPRFKAVIFVHGCFWHVHDGCKFSTRPSSRESFWREKFEANRKRDRKNYTALAERGWRVLIVWECAIKELKGEDLSNFGKMLVSWLRSDNVYGEISGRNVL